MVFHQEGIPGIFAKIQRLHPGENDSYVMEDYIVVPVEDIETTVSAPSVILRKIDSSMVSPLTPEVCFSLVMHNYCFSVFL